MALQAVYRDGKVTLDGWRSGESNHINKAEPTSLSPDGYEMLHLMIIKTSFLILLYRQIGQDFILRMM